MKELTFTAEISGLPPEVVFQILYFDKDFFIRYNTEVNGDSNARATEWSEDDTRVVTFQTPVNAPAIVAKCVGADTLRVREEQAITHKTKELYIVKSVPKLDLPGGDRFKTGGQVELRPAVGPTPGTAITMLARMECALWPLGSMMENFMGEQAKKTFEEWLHLLNVICREKVGMFGDGTDSEEYFDVTEESFPEEAFSDSEIVGDNSEAWYLKTILKELRALRCVTDTTDAKIASLDVRLARVEEALQTKVQTRKVSLVPDIPSSSFFGWTALVGVASVGVISAAHLYVKSHRF